jgi:ATP-dependent Clp protease ATP-binding subunit ClpB
MEELALGKETDSASVERLARLRADLASKEEDLRALRTRWEAEKAGLDQVGELKIRIDELRSAADMAQRDGDFEAAARILYAELPAMERELTEVSAAANSRSAMVKEEVGPDDIAEVVAAWTGIPAGRLLEGESAKLLRMEADLGRRVVGQAAAVRAVSDAVRRSRAGISDPDRPTGSFLFLGPTGVGKTELAKALAEFLFDDERAMTRIDMSEYGEKHSVARLVGAPPGYVGYEEGGQLTEAVRRRPYTVVLLDEIEKAHPEIFNILLQVLDDGRLTDGQGRTVDFRNAILILTSNIGSTFLVDETRSQAEKEAAVMDVVRVSFKPEFLNRLDEIVMFAPLGTDELTRIVDLQLGLLSRRLADRRLDLRVSEAAKEWLVLNGYDPAYGARPLRRLVQSAVGDQLARLILSGSVRDGATIAVDVAVGADGGPTGLSVTARGGLAVRAVAGMHGFRPPPNTARDAANASSDRGRTGASGC